MVYTAVGSSSAADGLVLNASEARTANLTLNLTPRKERPGMSQQHIERELRTLLQNVAGARGKVAASEAYTRALSGEDSELLAQHAATVEQELRSLAGIGQVTSSTGDSCALRSGG